MADTVHIAFPRMTDTSAVTPPNEPGVWEGVENKTFLIQAADGLEINWDAELAARNDLVSTPDVWAQVVTFEADLLTASRAPAGTQAAARHARALGEWRGLLALLALRHSVSIDVSGEKIDLKLLASQQVESPMRFAEVAYRLTPGQVLFEGMSWDVISTFKVGKRLVGLFNPATLIAPVKEYAKALGPAVTWFRGGRLIDPCADVIDLTPRQYLVLATFLIELHADLKARPSAGPASNLLLQLLEDYGRVALGRSSNEIAAEVLQPNTLTTVALPDSQPPYSKLIAAWEVMPNQPARFGTFLPLRPELGSQRTPNGSPAAFEIPFKGILLIDPKIAEKARVAIWGEVTLDAILNSNRVRKDVEEKAVPEAYICLDVDALFTDKLCEIVGSAGVAGHNDNVRQYILPLAPWLLMFVSADALRSAVRIAPTADGGQVVTVTLRLLRGVVGGTDPTDYEHTVSKVYRPATDILRREAPPAITLWPNFVSKDWRYYYVFYGDGFLGQHFSLRGPLYALSLWQGLSEAWHRSNGALAQLSNWFANTPVKAKRKETFRKDQRLSELYFQDSPVEALACDSAESDAADFVPSDRRVLVGIMLTPRPAQGATGANEIRLISPSGKAMTIGIDFGSTNTIVYRQVNGDPEPLKIEARVVNLMREVSDAPMWLDQHRSSMPVKAPPVPFMTILRSRDDDGSAQDIPLFKDYHYFIDNGAEQMGTILTSVESLHFNLKWKRDPADRERTARFLRQTMLMALAEAVAAGVRPEDVSWRFSYPEAFRPAELDDLAASYQGQLDQILPPVAEKKAIERRTESEAAALYFNHSQRAHLNQTMVVLDIGGGTTDIAIWHRRMFLWRNSIRVAGGNILLPFLARRPELVALIAKDSPTLMPMVKDWLESQSSQSHATRLNTLDVIVNQPAFSEAMKTRLALLTGTGGGLLLRQLVQTAYAGLIYYVGLQLRGLGTAVNWRDVNELRICFAGRGSLLFRDMLGGRQAALQDTTRLLPAVVGEEFKASVIFTEHPKHEVAYGLVVDRQIDDAKRTRTSVFGEGMQADGETLAATGDTSDLLGKNNVHFDPTLPSTQAFAALLQEFARIQLDLPRIKTDLLGRSDSAMAASFNPEWNKNAPTDKNGHGSQDVTLIEPPFSIILRELLKLISEAPDSAPVLKDL